MTLRTTKMKPGLPAPISWEPQHASFCAYDLTTIVASERNKGVTGG